MVPITLPRTPFLYVALVLLVMLPVVVVIVVWPGLATVWCKHFELPEYERIFGFKLGPLQRSGSPDAAAAVVGVESVAAGGVFARSGVRPGDVPSMYRGVGDLCMDLEAASEGRPVDLRVFNVGDRRDGRIPWRSVRLQRPGSEGTKR